MKKKTKVLLFGPELNSKNAYYGGGVGGYTRSMSIFLKYFCSDDFQLMPCFYSIRKTGKFFILMFPIRFIRDILIFTKDIVSIDPKIVHILGQYRKAVPREFFIVLISKIFKKYIVYEIIAGSFIKSFNSGNAFSKAMIRFILVNSKVILAEGELYIPFINEITKKPNCFYLPNFIPVEEVPDNIPGKLQQELLKVLFVGYCYEGKGVFELLEGLNLAAKKGIKISLTLVGSESHKFQDYMFVFKNDENLLINRKGVQPHEVVLEEMRLNDIYVYPTRHSGEGHTNSINEAMMNNMVIITTHAGFLSSILSDCAFFLKTVTAEEIAQTLLLISNNRPLALEKASAARTKFLDNYTSRTQIPKMNSFYQFALNGNH